MKAVIHVNNLQHQRTHARAMKAGLERHGVTVEFARISQPQACDIAVVWGWKQPGVIEAARARGADILVMERGYAGDRLTWTSCGWNGLNRRATFPAPDDGGARWEQHFGALMQPWRREAVLPLAPYILLCGQVPGDAALYGLDLDRWAEETADRIHKVSPLAVVFRPHPLLRRNGHPVSVPPAALVDESETLAQALAGAVCCVTYNSNAGVEAVLAGVPTITLDEGAMAWPVTEHTLTPASLMGAGVFDRRRWAHGLAWCQWTLDEIACGHAYDALKEVPIDARRAA